MQRWVFGLTTGLLLVFVAAGCGGTETVTETKTVTSAAATATGLGPPALYVQFGHIKSLTPKGDHYEMRFDPAWILSGVTANTAAAEDGAVDPGQPVPNDNYVVDEGHRLLTYLVPDNARVTVLAYGNNPGGEWAPTQITVSELAQIVDGESSLELFEPLETGVWLTVHVDTVRRIVQEYKP